LKHIFSGPDMHSPRPTWYSQDYCQPGPDRCPTETMPATRPMEDSLGNGRRRLSAVIFYRLLTE